MLSASESVRIYWQDVEIEINGFCVKNLLAAVSATPHQQFSMKAVNNVTTSKITELLNWTDLYELRMTWREPRNRSRSKSRPRASTSSAPETCFYCGGYVDCTYLGQLKTRNDKKFCHFYYLIYLVMCFIDY